MLQRILFPFLIVGSIISFAACNSAPPRQEVKSFEIDILRSGGFSSVARFYIHPDSILIAYTDTNGREMAFIQHWSDSAKQQIARLVNTWDLDDFETKEVGNQQVDDNLEFEFMVDVDSAHFEQHVYMKKIDELFALTNLVDQYLPEERRIWYNDQYFSY